MKRSVGWHLMKKNPGMLKSCAKAGMHKSCAWTWQSCAKAGMLISCASTWTQVHLFIFTIRRPYSRLTRMNMPVKWHIASHITCKIKHKKICYMDISWRKKNPVYWNLAQKPVCSYLAHGHGIRFILIYTIMRPYSRIKCMNMPVKWHIPSHITHKIKQKKDLVTCHER